MSKKSTNNKQSLSSNKNPLLAYENKWVAMTPDRKKVVVSGKSFKEVDRKLEKIGDKDAVLLKVLPFDKAYSP